MLLPAFIFAAIAALVVKDVLHQPKKTPEEKLAEALKDYLSKQSKK